MSSCLCVLSYIANVMYFLSGLSSFILLFPFSKRSQTANRDAYYYAKTWVASVTSYSHLDLELSVTEVFVTVFITTCDLSSIAIF